MTKTQAYDFQDGNGPVPAHKHPNGGGWVADTAFVAETSYVSTNAEVYENANIYGNARVLGKAKVFGDAYLSGNRHFAEGGWKSGTHFDEKCETSDTGNTSDTISIPDKEFQDKLSNAIEALSNLKALLKS